MYDKKSGEENKDIADSVALMLSPLLNTYKQNIDKMLQPFGISAGQPPLLLMLYEKDGQLQKNLAKKLNVKPASLTGMLTRMEKADLIKRLKIDSDKRASHVYLTDKGRRLCKKIQAIMHFINERNLAGFRHEEKILLLRFLEHMQSNLDKQREELLIIKKEEALRGSAVKPDTENNKDY